MRWALGMLIIAALLTGCGLTQPAAHTSTHSPSASAAAQACVSHSCATATWYLGVSAIQTQQVAGFSKLIGAKPNLVEVYLHFGDPLPDVGMTAILAEHATPLVTVNPWGNDMTNIAAGKDDDYLKSLGRYFAAMHAPVAVALGPEQNGNWFPWGCGHLAAATYIEAWRHFEDVIRPLAPNVIWVWTVNKVVFGTCPARDRWPGSAYVDWVGLDAYWRHPGNDWATAIQPSLTTIRSFTSLPVMITETGARRSRDAAHWITSLFAGARATPGVIGIVWFNAIGANGDYRLQDDPAALQAFRQEVRAQA